MRLTVLIAAFTLATASPCVAQTQARTGAGALPPPTPIEEWPLSKVSSVGAEMYRLDSAAWVATDALRAAVDEAEVRSIRGWLIEPTDADGLTVHFYRQGEPDPIPRWDVVVRAGKAEAVTPAVETSLTQAQLSQARALATARANVGTLRCSPTLNTVIMDDPDSDGWLVWLLTPMPEDRKLPMGGHYRFRISADGASVLRRDQLSNTCLFLDRPPGRRGEAMLVTSHIVSSGPIETQVFLSIQNQVTIVVLAGDRYFSVGGARIADITDRVNKR